MSKIICDVCGTRHPDTAEQCPICGRIRTAAGKTAEEVQFTGRSSAGTREKVRGGRFSKSNVKKRTGGHATRYEAPPAKTKAHKMAAATGNMADEDIFTEDQQNKKAGMILNILLVIVILALLAVTGYIFVQHVLPVISKPEETLPPTVPATTAAPTEIVTEPVETEEPTIPCQELLLEETEILLTEYEQKWLINVDVKPADTTDGLTFVSADELIATVDAEGCITALAEGQTYITVTCGDVQVQYDVICLFPGVDIKPGEEPTEEPPTEPPIEMTITTNNVNVRSGPDTSYDKIRQLKKGDKILVYETKTVAGREWGRLEDGWVCLDYAK